MQEKLQQYFAQKRAEQKQARDRLLIQEGLYEKVYMPEGGSVREYDEIEYGEAASDNRRFKKVAITVTDEEFAQIRQLSQSAPASRWNPVLLLRIIAGLFLGVALLSMCYEEEIFALFPYLFFSAVTLGFAELIAALKK